MPIQRVSLSLSPIPLSLPQEFLKTSFSAKSLKGAISQLQSLPPLAPLASGIQASLARIFYSVLGWVEALESLLRNMGVDAPAGDTGPSSPHTPSQLSCPSKRPPWPQKARGDLAREESLCWGQAGPSVKAHLPSQKPKQQAGWVRAGHPREEPESVGSMGPACSGFVGTELQTGPECSVSGSALPPPILGALGGCQASAPLSLLPGMAAYMKQLLDQHHSITGQVQALQVTASPSPPLGVGQLSG